MTEIILVSVLGAAAVAALIISIRAFLGDSFPPADLLQEWNEKIDKKLLYKQSAVVFLLGGIILLLDAVNLILKMRLLIYVVIVLVAAEIIYAVISAVKIMKSQSNK